MKIVKNLVLFMLTAILLVACGDTVNGQPTITIGQALGVCFHRASYVIPLIISLIVSGGGIYALVKKYQRDQDWTVGDSLIAFALLAIFLFALLYVPAEMAANTTVEQYNRGVYIG
jgi:hypothetical protein